MHYDIDPMECAVEALPVADVADKKRSRFSRGYRCCSWLCLSSSLLKTIIFPTGSLRSRATHARPKVPVPPVTRTVFPLRNAVVVLPAERRFVAIILATVAYEDRESNPTIRRYFYDFLMRNMQSISAASDRHGMNFPLHELGFFPRTERYNFGKSVFQSTPRCPR